MTKILFPLRFPFAIKTFENEYSQHLPEAEAVGKSETLTSRQQQ